MKNTLQKPILAYSLAFLLGATSNVSAAPGQLSQSPLFLQTAAPPNVFILNDNSSSMLWELLTKDYAESARVTIESDVDTPELLHPAGCVKDENNDGHIIKRDGSGNIMEIELRAYGFILQKIDTDPTLSYACETVAEEEWRGRLFDYNKLYYNPNRKYEPWAGKDSNGNAFANASITAAKIDPYDPNSETIDLTQDSAVLVAVQNETVVNGETITETALERRYYSSSAWSAWCSASSIPQETCRGWRYYTWQDSNDNDTIEQNELTRHWVKDLPDDTSDNPPVNTQTNFANWFSYHRSREYAAKYALSQTINQISSVRIGYGTINNSDINKVTIDYPDTLDSLSDPTTHKQDVLTKLFNTTSNSGTPLRTKLEAVGEYYKTGLLFGESVGTPILPADQGGSCQSNNTILMTDGFYNGNPPSVGGADNDNGMPYADAYSNTLADVAMYYYETDLSDLPDLTGSEQQIKALVYEKDYTDDINDTAGHQHMNTHTLAFGLEGTIEPTTKETINADGFTWPDPLTDDLTKIRTITSARIDDLFHAAVNGRGNYFSASSPDNLVQALLALLDGFNNQVPSATAVAMSSFQPHSGSLIYSSQFNTDGWHGEMLAHQIIFNDNGSFSFNQEWSAADQITNPTTREIITYNGTSGVAFQWGIESCTNCINAAMKAQLTAGDTETGIGEARLQYLRGETANAFNFRERDSLLGDIVNSSPVYVAAPASPFPNSDPFGTDGNRHYDFWNSKKNRTPMLYVGANDGMLHGFNALTGAETIAYVPETIFPNLHELSNPNYVHRYFVDQTPSVGDAYFDNLWHTVLVSGLGAGGRGLFALDVTDPVNFSEANADSIALWELNSADDSDLGYTLSKPVIALTSAGWVVITGNGYNSDDGIAKLFIIKLDPENIVDGWNVGSDFSDLATEYIKISTGIGSSDDKNGLSSPTAVDTNGDGYVDRVYAGDLKGNLWAFDLSGSSNEWGVAYTNGTGPQALFQARSSAGEVQPITVKPSVIRHPHQPTVINTSDPDKNTSPNLMIFFGTGQYLTSDDLTNTQTQTFYGIWDNGSSALTRDNLVSQAIRSGTDSSLSITARIIDPTAPVLYGDTANSQRYGWLIDLDSPSASTGERVISNAIVFNNIVFFNTYTPNNAPCDPGGGSWFMFVNAHNGGNPDEPIINITRNDRDVNVGDLVNLTIGDDRASDQVPAGLQVDGTLGSPTLGLGESDTGTALIHTNDNDDSIKGFAIDVGAGALGKRISWRELREP